MQEGSQQVAAWHPEAYLPSSLICKALGKRQAQKRPRVSGVAVQGEGHAGRSGSWSVPKQSGFRGREGLMEELS